MYIHWISVAIWIAVWKFPGVQFKFECSLATGSLLRFIPGWYALIFVDVKISLPYYHGTPCKSYYKKKCTIYYHSTPCRLVFKVILTLGIGLVYLGDYDKLWITLCLVQICLLCHCIIFLIWNRSVFTSWWFTRKL